jgi:hypothetical protein
VRSTRQQPRFAGFLYLLLALTAAPVGLLYFPGKLPTGRSEASRLVAPDLLLSQRGDRIEGRGAVSR